MIYTESPRRHGSVKRNEAKCLAQRCIKGPRSQPMSMRVAQATVVNLASIYAVKDSGRLLCPGLGSCLAVCALDPITNVAGVAHLMLPKAPENVVETIAAKFVDSGLSALLVRL